MASKFSVEAIFSATDGVTKTLRKIRGEVSGFGRATENALKGANRAVNKGLGAIKRFSTELGVAGVASIAGIGYQLADVIRQGAEFEQVLVKTGAAFEVPVKKGTKAFEELVTAARNVGRTTEFSGAKAAHGLNSLATAGYSVDQSIAALPKIVDFASAAQLELGQASDIASDTLGAFSLRSSDAAENAENMGRIMDVMSRAAADSTTNVAELFESIRMGGAFAATSGASIEQFTAMAGVLANRGIKGSEAGTAIRNSFLHLTKVTPEATRTMKKLGITIAKTEAGAIDMPATIGRFSKATEKLTKAQKAQAVASVFGAYTVGPFLNLMNAGEGEIRKFTKNLEKANGTTKTMAETMRDSTAAKIQKFWNIITDVKLGVFEAISDTVLDIAGNIGDWAVQNEKLISMKADEWAKKLKESLPEIAMWTERIAKALAGFLVLSAVVKVISLVATVIGGLATAFAWAEFTALLLGTTIGAVVWPIVLIGLAIAGLVALIWAYWPEIKAFFSKVYDWAVDAIGRMWDWIKDAFGKAKEFLKASFEFLVGLFRLIFAPQIEALKGYYNAIKFVLGAVFDYFKGVWNAIGEVLTTAWDAIVEAHRPYYDAFVFLWSGLKDFFRGLWDEIAGFAIKAFDWISEKLDPILEAVGKFIKTVRAVGRITLGTETDVDEEVARERRAAHVISPQARAAAEIAEANATASVGGTITVRAEPGTKAVAKTKPGKVPIALQPSGAF